MAGIVYFVTSDKIGNQDSELGQKLMHNFLVKLLDASPQPTHLLFVESGVKLLLAEFSGIDSLKIMETKGVKLLACQTCLDYYDIREKITVGCVSNMPEIIKTLHEAEKVISI